MKKAVKRIFLFIMLLCCCIVFTGCGGNSNSYDDADVSNLHITVYNNVINTETNSYSTRASINNSDLRLFFNDIEFQGHSSDSENNYVFTNVMYTSKAYEMTNADASSTIIIALTTGETLYKIEFANIDLPVNLSIRSENGKIVMYNGANPVHILKVNDKTDGYTDLTEVIEVKIEKYNSTTAKVTFYNVLKQGIKLDYTYWKISALNSELDPIESWTNEENSSSTKLNISKPQGTDNYYLISLTESGLASAHSHNLANTIVGIDYITDSNHKDLVSTYVLRQGIYRP